jgi:hypothetical protein
MRVVSTYVSLIVAFPDFSLLHFVATSYGDEAMTACRGFRRSVVAFSAQSMLLNHDAVACGVVSIDGALIIVESLIVAC